METAMVNQDRPKAKLKLRGLPESSSTQRPDEQLKPELMRTQEELTPLAMRIAENTTLMQRFRAVAGSDDKERALEMIDEITKYAQNLDPSISFSEGTRIVVVLMKILGPPKGELND